MWGNLLPTFYAKLNNFSSLFSWLKDLQVSRSTLCFPKCAFLNLFSLAITHFWTLGQSSFCALNIGIKLGLSICCHIFLSPLVATGGPSSQILCLYKYFVFSDLIIALFSVFVLFVVFVVFVVWGFLLQFGLEFLFLSLVSVQSSWNYFVLFLVCWRLLVILHCVLNCFLKYYLSALQ